MTDILGPVAPSLFEDNIRDGPYYSMPEATDRDWRDHYLGASLSMLSNWPTASSHESLPSIPVMDVRLLHHNNDQFVIPYGGPTQLVSPSMSYMDGSWTSDVDMGTPSTTTFAHDLTNERYTLSSRLPPAPAHSPHSSHGGEFSPYPVPVSIPSQQPTFNGPETRARTNKNSATLDARPNRKKRSLAQSEDGDTSYSPNQTNIKAPTETKPTPAPNGESKDATPRGRKRQRIPHTAVERRYRENLNAHLEKLRQVVPQFNTPFSPAVGGKLGETAIMGTGNSSDIGANKPSKCEILNGAIEHIRGMTAENQALREEVERLRERAGWGFAAQGGGGGGDGGV